MRHPELVYTSPKCKFTVRLVPSEERDVYELEIDWDGEYSERLPLDEIATLRRALDARNLEKVNRRSRGDG